jgi:CDP-diacylglycerol--glycerol-3-phosphate 3-phosphatidyltransferase
VNFETTAGSRPIALSGSGSYPFARQIPVSNAGPGLGPLLRIEKTVKLTGDLEKPFYAAVNPLVERLIRAGVRPNTITTIGTGLVLVSAIVYATGHIRIGGLLLLLSGVADTLDGQVARGGAMVTRFGALYDSTLDRVGDGATFIGIGAFLLTAPDVAYRTPAVILCMIAILGSLLVSYARARAEGLGLDCKVGIAQRAERILGLGLASVVFGAGRHALLLEAIVALLAIASLITVVQRFVYVYQHAGQADRALRAEETRHAEEMKLQPEMKNSPEVKRAALDPIAKGS